MRSSIDLKAMFENGRAMRCSLTINSSLVAPELEKEVSPCNPFELFIPFSLLEKGVPDAISTTIDGGSLVPFRIGYDAITAFIPRILGKKDVIYYLWYFTYFRTGMLPRKRK